MRFICLNLILALATLASQAQAFRHPGIYQSANDMARMRELVRNGPEEYRSAYKRLMFPLQFAPTEGGLRF